MWFSDLWDLRGIYQKIDHAETRKRSAAYPFELPYRLINMYSLRGDTVLDPFVGTGTTTLAAIASCRNSVGYEIDAAFFEVIMEHINSVPVSYFNAIVDQRIELHKQFIIRRAAAHDGARHFHKEFDFPVMTLQETEITFSYIDRLQRKSANEVIADYSPVTSLHLNKSLKYSEDL